MTHSLHRKGEAEDLSDDYVMIVMAGRDRIKNEAVRERMRAVWDVLTRHEASLANYGTIRGGGRHRKPMETYRGSDAMMVHAVFKAKEPLQACLRELKERDLGISVAVSGCDERVREACAEIGLAPHTVQHSLGVLGRTEKLPDEHVLEVATMCGHAMVSPRLVAHVVDRIDKGKMTYEEGAARLSTMCDCGVFNPHRAERLLREMI